MTEVVLVTSLGLPELTFLHGFAQPPLVYNIATHTTVSDQDFLPAWTQSLHSWRSPFFAARSLQDRLAALEDPIVITLGAEAGYLAAGALADFPFMAALYSTELDVSVRRKARAHTATTVVKSASKLLLETPWEMGKAASLGSRSPHLQLPLTPVWQVPILSTGTADTSAGDILVVSADLADDAHTVEHLRELARQYRPPHAAPTRVTHRSVQQLIESDGSSLVNLTDTLRNQFGRFSHVVIFGDHPTHISLMRVLAAQPDRVIVASTLNGDYAADALGIRSLRGQRLLTHLVDEIFTQGRSTRKTLAAGIRSAARRLPRGRGWVQRNVVDRLEPPFEPRRLPVPPPGDLVQPLLAEIRRATPWYYEQLWSTPPPSIDVFCTVAPIEDRSNGARPQRIRFMADAFGRQGATLAIHLTKAALSRRQLLLEDLVDQGVQVGTMYGESSTSPMVDDQLIEAVGALITSARSAGAASSWFIRDLHWLTDEQVRGYHPSQELRARGLREIRMLIRTAGTLVAPNQASAAAFRNALAAAGVSSEHWRTLPPGFSEESAGSISRFGRHRGTTFVYTGGMSDFYRQDTFLRAFRNVSKHHHTARLDLVVRPAEAASVNEALERAQLQGSAQVRLINETFDSYLPTTRASIGVIFLEGEYAGHSFPFKTMAMLQRGLAILCFDDMAIADYVTDLGVGMTCGRSVSDVEQLLTRALRRRPMVDPHRLAQTQSWDARVRTLKSWAS
ncbi:MAG: hypothetical protein ACK5KU_12070 [Beutenbergiaceae bacterium]